MSQKEIEMILTRQLASYLAMPVFLVDVDGNLSFYNEPAETILGLRFEETGEIPGGEWTTAFAPTDSTGAPLAPAQLPLIMALTKQRPVHSAIYIQGRDQVRRYIEITAFPLIGQAGRKMGAVALFWEVQA